MAQALSTDVAQYVAQARYEGLPPEAVTAAKWSLLDSIGVIAAASTLADGCAPFAHLARHQGGNATSTVLGYGFLAPASAAALVNGSLAHALDYDDTHDTAPVHPSAQTVPVALALAELGGASGRDLLTALVIGTDLSCRLGLALREDLTRCGWCMPPILDAFGATAAGAALLGLSERQVLDAFSLILSQATAFSEVSDSPGSDLRGVRDAFGAQAAVLSAQLAARGVRGFDQPLEGRAGLFALYDQGNCDPSMVTRDLGVRYRGAEVSHKPWPSTRGTHPFVDAALRLRADNLIYAADIDRVILRGSAWSEMLAPPAQWRVAPATAIDAKFSLPFTVATALVHGNVTLASFFPAALRDRRVLELARRVQYAGEEPGSEHEPVTLGTVEIVTRGGESCSARCDRPYGAPQSPISEHDLIAKYQDCVAHAARPLSNADADQVVTTVLSLEDVADVRSELTAVLAV